MSNFYLFVNTADMFDVGRQNRIWQYIICDMKYKRFLQTCFGLAVTGQIQASAGPRALNTALYGPARADKSQQQAIIVSESYKINKESG
jgi:hypothetical protein